MVKMMSYWALVGLAACLAVLSGCASVSQPEFLDEYDVPLGGEAMPAGLWAAVDENSAQGRPDTRSQRNSLWVLPFQFSYAQTSLYSKFSDGLMVDGSSRANTAETFRIDWNDLLAPYLGVALPLRVIVRDYGYAEGADNPVRRRGVGYTPFWAWTWDDGGTRHAPLEYRAAGVPLLYWQLKGGYGAPGDDKTRVRLDLYQALWTLGPAVIKLDMRLDGDEVRGYLANPLLLGGALGHVLWTDYTFRAPGRFASGHGPALGMLGYTNHTFSRAGGGSEKLRFAVAGVLWSEYMEKVPDGRVIDAKRGPLWSMFGWGRKDGRFAVRALWQTIPIGRTPQWAIDARPDVGEPTAPAPPPPPVAEPVDQRSLSAAW